MKTAAYFSLAFLFSYVLTAFLWWKLNPYEWLIWGRLFFLFSLMWSCLIAFAVSIDEKPMDWLKKDNN